MVILLTCFVVGWIITGFVVGLFKRIIFVLKPDARIYGDPGLILLGGSFVLISFLATLLMLFQY